MKVKNLKTQIIKEYKNKSEKELEAGFEFDAIFILSTESIDRDGDIIVQDWDLSKYNEEFNGEKGGIVFFQHDTKNLPVGKCYAWVEDNQLLGGVKFSEASELSKTVKKLVEEGILKYTSVGFIPRDAEKTEEGYRFIKNELLEVSIVGIPANSEAKLVEVYKEYNKKIDDLVELEILRKWKENNKEILKKYRKELKFFREALNLPKLEDEVKSIEQVFSVLRSFLETPEDKEKQDETRFVFKISKNSKLAKYVN